MTGVHSNFCHRCFLNCCFLTVILILLLRGNHVTHICMII